MPDVGSEGTFAFCFLADGRMRVCLYLSTHPSLNSSVYFMKNPSSWHPGFGARFLSTLLYESFYFQYALVIITIER